MPGKTQSKRRNGKRGECSYCRSKHRKGKKNDSCRRGAANIERLKPKLITEEAVDNRGARRKPGGNSDIAVARRARAKERVQARKALTDAEQLLKITALGFADSKEAKRLNARIEAAEAKKEKVDAVDNN